MARPHVVLILVFALGASMHSVSALAQPPASRPQIFRAPPACGTAAEFTRALATGLGRPVDSSMLKSLSVEILHSPTGFEAHIKFANTLRLIQGTYCRDVASAAALVAAIAIGPAEAHPPEDDAIVTVSVEPPPRVATGIPSSWSGGVRGHLAADIGTIPSVGLAGGAAVWLGAHQWRAELGAGIYQPQDEFMPAVEAGAKIRLWTATATACRSIRQIALCSGGEAGVMRADGFGFASSRRADLTWLAWTTSLRLTFPLGSRAAGTASLQAVVPYAPPRFTADDGSEVFAASELAIRFKFGVEGKVF